MKNLFHSIDNKPTFLRVARSLEFEKSRYSTPKILDCHESRMLRPAVSPSPGISQPSRNPVDSCGKSVVYIVGILASPFPAQQLNLNQTQWIDVRISQPNRAGQHRVLLE